MDFVDDGKPEGGKSGCGVFLLGEALEHAHDNVFVVNINDGSLDESNAGGGEKGADAFSPLGKEEFFVNDDESLDAKGCDEIKSGACFAPSAVDFKEAALETWGSGV